MLATSQVIGWLKSLGWNDTQEYGAPLVAGPYIQKVPDRIVHITMTPGPGYVMEAAADASAFQARVRGPQNDQDTAERLAQALDRLILGAPFPVTLADGQVLIHVHRLAAGPTLLTPGPDDAERSELTCQYVAIAST